MAMLTDYDAPRTTATVEAMDTSLQALIGRSAVSPRFRGIDVDELDLVAAADFPGADLSADESSLGVIPMQDHEFHCSSCFLIHHRRLLIVAAGAGMLCRDCAS